MTLGQAWMDSLTLLKPRNLKIFAMTTLKSIVEAYKLIVYFFWWIVPAFVVFVLGLFFVLTYLYPSYYGSLKPTPDLTLAWFNMPVGTYVLYILLFLAVCFITRSSVAQKDWHYLGRCYRKIILYWLIIALYFNVSAINPMYVFLVLFFLDSEGGPKNFLLSVWYAVKMYIFNFPLFFIMDIFLYAPGWLNIVHYVKYGSFIAISSLISNILSILLLPIGICIYANIYIKKLHDQFDLYNKQPQ